MWVKRGFVGGIGFGKKGENLNVLYIIYEIVKEQLHLRTFKCMIYLYFYVYACVIFIDMSKIHILLDKLSVIR